MKLAAILCMALGLASPAAAQSFNVLLGGKTLGQMTFSQSGGTLFTTLDNTPLGVFDGTFNGTARSAGNGTTTFTGISRSSRKSRKVTVDFAQDRASRVVVEPDNERTELSELSRVPPSVTDPVSAIGKLIGAKGCPPPLRIYEGRRVIALSPGQAEQGNARLVCPVAYDVIAGPGHLSPLRISSAKMVLTYAISNGAQTLQQIALSSGIFGLTLVRTD